MPFINTKVNQKISKEQEVALKEKLGKAIEILGKSENWLMVGFEDDYSLYFKGDGNQKTAFVEVQLFGKASEFAYQTLTAEICKLYEQILGIDPARIYVKYEEVANWGWNGSNF